MTLMGLTSANRRNPTGGSTPAERLDDPSMSTQEPEDDSSDVECPTCGESFKNERGMKIHHSKAHAESISGTDYECRWCGEIFHVEGNPEREFCSKGCFDEWQRESGVHSGKNNPQWDGGDDTLVCEWCGEEYDVYPAVADSSRFCSVACKGEWMSENFSGENHPQWAGRETRECKFCGSDFQTAPETETLFCSQRCYGDWRSENLVGEDHPKYITDRIQTSCDYCGEEYSRLSHHSNSRFCSSRCYGDWRSENLVGEDHPHWEGGDFPYGAGWTERKRKQVREEQNRKCAGCGTHESYFSQKLDVHHIQPARTFDDAQKRNDPSNLVALCRSCHHKAEKQAPLLPDFANAD